MHFLALTNYHKIAALVLTAAMLMWSFGFPTWIPRTNAVSLTWVSDTLSDSDLSVLSNHTIQFTTPTGIANGETITVTLSAAWNISTSSVDFSDIDVATTSDFTLAADCTGAEQVGAAIAGQVLTLTFCAGDGGSVPAAGTTTIEIGTNATFGVAGDQQITNPGTAGSYVVSIAGTQTDSGETRVAIIDDVVVTASVDTTFTFTIAGVNSGSTVNSSPTTTADNTTATTLPFGTMAPSVSKTLAQDLAVTTNATNGFTVTVVQNQNLTSSTGADIDRFIDDAGTASPTGWIQPTGTIGDEDTYGHMGITSEDADLNSNEFGNDLWAGNFVNNAREVFSHTGPADGATANQGSTRVGYQVQITSLQEAGSDYTATLTYVATPTF